MKTSWIFLLGMLAFGGMSCNDDDDGYKPEDAVTRAFEQKYPEANRVEWKSKETYKVVEFYEEGVEKEAWFDKDGNWYMTESDIPFEALPVAVKQAFKASDYAQWKVDDVDKLERSGMENVYVIEVEQGKQEYDLYYAEEGSLLKTVADSENNEHRPEPQMNQKVKDYLEIHYAGARMLDYDVERQGIEVDIYHDGKHKEVKFDSEGNWISTDWEVLKKDVPAVVMNAVQTRYADYRIDDVDFVERAAGVSVYLFELEKGEAEIHVMVDEAGNIVE